ncbi:MAG: hypothetical protein ACRDOL_13235 [Streptosporangiaceae bacterium]
MALRNYPCILLRANPPRSGKTDFREVDRYTFEMDLEDGMGYTIRAALVHGAIRNGGPEADIGQYRLTILDPDKNRVRIPQWAASPEPVTGRPAGSLADCTDDHLIGELARRLRGR